MWGTVLVVALLAVPDPVRLSVALMLISRPRPMRNLFVYWLSAMATATVTVLGLLTLLRNFAPTLTQMVADAAASATARHIQIAVGAVALAIAAGLVRGISAHHRHKVVAAGGGLDLGVSADIASEPAGHAKAALKGGAFWFAVLVGIGLPPEHTVVVLTAILASEAGLITQIGAAMVFILVMLALVELPLVTYLFRPAQTEAGMRHLCSWVLLHRRRIIAAILGLAGIFLMANGMAGF